MKAIAIIPATWISFFLFLLAGTPQLLSQQYVLIEKRGNPHTERIAMYEKLTFQLRDDNTWHTRQILGMDAKGQMIELGDAWIPLSDLTRLKLQRQRTWVNIIGTALQAGGAGMILFDMYHTVQGDPEYSQGGWESGLVNIAVGTGMKALLAPIKYRLGGKHRLRIVDLTF